MCYKTASFKQKLDFPPDVCPDAENSPEKFLDTNIVVRMAPCGETRTRESACLCAFVCVFSVTAHLKFPPGVELAQTLHSLLAVHHGGHRGTLLKEEAKPPFNITFRATCEWLSINS